MSEWKAIDSAPKDGQPFRVYGPELVHPDFNPWGQVEAVYEDDRLFGAIWDGQFDCWNSVEISDKATHWQPFPASPLPSPPPAGHKDYGVYAPEVERELSMNYTSDPPVAPSGTEPATDHGVIAAIRTVLWEALSGREMGGDRTLVGMVKRLVVERDEARENRRGEFDLRMQAEAALAALQEAPTCRSDQLTNAVARSAVSDGAEAVTWTESHPAHAGTSQNPPHFAIQEAPSLALRQLVEKWRRIAKQHRVAADNGEVTATVAIAVAAANSACADELDQAITHFSRDTETP